MTYLKRLGAAALATMAVMALAGASTASATTFSVGGVAQNKSVELTLSLESGSSALLKDSAGTTTDTCTESVVKGKTEGTFTGASIGGAVSSLTFAKCSHTTTVIKPGKLSLTHISGTSNGTVTSSEAEVTVMSTAFGVSAVCKTGSGTDIGTFTGATTASNPAIHATVDINGKISCGILGTSTWTGGYWVTEPTDIWVLA